MYHGRETKAQVECEAEHKAVLVEKSCGNDMLILLATIHVIDDRDAGWNVVLERKISLAIYQYDTFFLSTRFSCQFS